MKAFGPVFVAKVDGRESVFVLRCDEALKMLPAEHKTVEADWPFALNQILSDDSLIFKQGTAAHGRMRKIWEKVCTSVASACTARAGRWAVQDHCVR